MKNQLIWHWLKVWPVEAFVFGADAALAFSYIRFTQANNPTYQPSIRKLVANVPGLSNHRARFVMDCYDRRLMIREGGVMKSSQAFAAMIDRFEQAGKSYKRIRWKTKPNKDRLSRFKLIEEQLAFIMSHSS